MARTCTALRVCCRCKLLTHADRDDANHPDHALFQQIRGHVVALDHSLGRKPDVHTDQLA
jgi:hypothetical protein